MPGRLLPAGDGHTELSGGEFEELIPTYIATRGELFEAEEHNIAKALLRRPPTAEQLLDDKYLRELHRAMFGEVWRWAGQYRQTEKSIGIAAYRISAEVRIVTDDARFWVEHTTYEPDAMAVRFHHRLVHIHPFTNGNGRHGRIAADYLIRALGEAPFSWGQGIYVPTTELRAAYVGALKKADAGDITELLAFARS